ncbi:alpha-glucan family phosphorylase [Rhizobium aegyptiacum]|uniref:alpha-glucan family phosphorylase n=1 Tax=Rhizobium aegyptiacum TaxID=1764550 RepID=UPI000AAA5AAD|nr:alpha-glucan family phosphorylase [Rhizobium aegyptiacum]
MRLIETFARRTHIAYFSMEIALRPEIHTYSGGLGVLAGDTARSAADLNLPMVFVSLLSRDGYVRQTITPDGVQVSEPNPWSPEDWARPLASMVAVSIEGKDVWIRPWLYVVKCPLGNRLPVLLLDTDLDQNVNEDRKLTSALYGGDSAYRLKQEVVLGIGGALVLQALGFAIRTFHLNEGHAALLPVFMLAEKSRMLRPGPDKRADFDVAAVRRMCIFTTHTPVEAGFDRFGYDLVQRTLGEDFVPLDTLKELGGQDRLNMTQLALNLSGYVNGVATRHAETTRKMFPGYDIKSITNGVHVHTWMHSNLAKLVQEQFPNWAHEPEVLVFADQLDDDSVWHAHRASKRELIDLVSHATGTSLREDLPLIGLARRMTAYKRPDLLFSDLGTLSSIAREHPFQVVVSGLAHPRDESGLRVIKAFHDFAVRLKDVMPVVFLPGYDMERAAVLVAGCDIWLNTPLPPLEASGTSGMKAALNGTLNLSVLDGWWVEGCVDGVTGWSIEGSPSGSGDAAALYVKLRDTVLPLYYGDRARWIWMMKQSISKLGSTFTSHRMLRRYITEAYVSGNDDR